MGQFDPEINTANIFVLNVTVFPQHPTATPGLTRSADGEVMSKTFTA
jgi:hypothetical protein